jgi:hypothetical protein
MSSVVRAAACIAVGVELFLTGIGVSLPIESAGAADNCAASPGAAAPKGQHWYYRVDQVNHRKCWYLHAPVALLSRTAAEPRAARSESARSVATSPSPSADAPQTPDAADDGGEVARIQPKPRVTVLNVKPAAEPPTGTIFPSEAAVPEQTDEPPTANVPVDADVKPVTRAHRAAVHATFDSAHDSSAPARGEVAATAQTRSAWLLFPLLMLALGIAAGLIALLRKIGASSRMPRLSEHPADAWRRYGTPDRQADEVRYQEDAPFLAPHEPYAAVDLDAPEWPDRPWPAKADLRPSPRYGKPRQPQHASLAQDDVERRPRVPRQPRRGTVPSKTER